MGVAAITFLAALACAELLSADQNKQSKAETTRKEKKAKTPQSIGMATMNSEGTIILDLRAEGAGGARGDARLLYPRGHKQYDEILKHLGGLRPGEKKPVPPWPENR